MLTLTAPEMTVLVGGMRALGANYVNISQRFSDSRSLLAVSRDGRFVRDQTIGENESFNIDGPTGTGPNRAKAGIRIILTPGRSTSCP